MAIATRILAVIPARANSKRIKGKNLKKLGGKPLVCYTIEAALRSRLLDRIVISTDIDEMPRIAARYRSRRLEVLRRAPELCGDRVTTEQVLIDAVEKLGLRRALEAVVTLLPTSPFRTPGIIDGCIRLFRARKADSVVTMSRMKLKIADLDEATGRLHVRKEYMPAAMHKVPLTLCENPALHMTRLETLLRGRYTLGERNYGYEIDRVTGMDINDPIEWALAEAVLEKGLVKSSGTSRT